jgi:hypothetical protein
MAVWFCWGMALAAVFAVLVVVELMEAGLAFGSAQYAGKADDRAMALYMIPPMMAFVAAVGYVTVVWPARLRKQNRRDGLGDW